MSDAAHTHIPSRWVVAPGSSPAGGLEAEAGRFVVYGTPHCPYASRVLAGLALRGLAAAVPFVEVNPVHRPGDWTFDEGYEDPAGGRASLREVYLETDPAFGGRVTVPVLYDTRERRIVNTESAEILRMVGGEAFAALAAPGAPDLYPEPLRAEIDRWNERLGGPLNGGVYGCLFAADQAAYEAAEDRVFAALDECEERLASSRYLAGDRLTEADVRLFTTLVRFDRVYHRYFKCSRRRLADYEALPAYTRDLYQTGAMATSVDMPKILAGYYRGALAARFAPNNLVPTGPALDLDAPHGRAALPGTPPGPLGAGAGPAAGGDDGLPATMRAVALDGFGAPAVMSVRGGAPVPRPAAGEVLIRVRYTAINRADTLQRKGGYAPPPGASETLGLEAVGEVAAVGPGGSSRGFAPGDRVMALLPGGGYAEYVAVHEGSATRVPDGLALREAASVPETWLTAFQLLDLAGVARGDRVLVHAAGSGVAAAAIQMAVARGAEVLATAGSAAKLAHARGLGAAGAWNYKEEDFAAKALEHTGGRGVTVILDCVGGGAHWERNTRCVALEGRWVVYGLMGGAQPDGLSLLPLLRKRVTMIGTTLRTRSNEYKARLVRRFEEQALPRLADGSFRTVVDSEFKLEDVADAHTRMEQNLNTGKIILNVAAE